MARFRATADGNIPFTPAEDAERDAEQAAWLAGENGRLADAARQQRDALLAATDWRVIKLLESGRLQEYASLVGYRQDLRDIPTQPGFPQNIIWPSIEELSA
jgi:hypothetical protein